MSRQRLSAREARALRAHPDARVSVQLRDYAHVPPRDEMPANLRDLHPGSHRFVHEISCAVSELPDPWPSWLTVRAEEP